MRKINCIFFLFLLSLICTEFELSEGLRFGDYRFCFKEVANVAPCAFEISSFNLWKRPISSSCCSKISKAAATNCALPLPYYWFVNSQTYCTAALSSPPPPPSQPSPLLPPPPSRPSPILPPPPSRPTPIILPEQPANYHMKNCPEFNILPQLCIQQFYDYYIHDQPISSSCCTTYLSVFNTCTKTPWSKISLKCHDYCQRQLSSP
ncbi:hypothetical protein CsatB_021780 [Cannabis sativa]